MLAFDFFLYILIGIYFDNVLPRTYGVRRNACFCFTPSFWCSTPNLSSLSDELEQLHKAQPTAEQMKNFQQETQRPVVLIKGLVKVVHYLV
jgi:hypothetical protein